MLQVIRLRHLRSRPTGAGARLLSFLPDSPVRFTAGQHALWMLPGGGVKPFSIASAPGEETIDLATFVHDGSRIKRALHQLDSTATVRLLGPLGRLAPPSDGRPIVLLAQGIGVTAARSVLRTPRSVQRTLVHVGAPHFQDELRVLADRTVYPEGRRDFLDQLNPIAAAQPDAHYLLAGARAFVRDTARRLHETGIPPRQIRQDPFYGLVDRAPRSSPAEVTV